MNSGLISVNLQDTEMDVSPGLCRCQIELHHLSFSVDQSDGLSLGIESIILICQRYAGIPAAVLRERQPQLIP